MKPNARQTPKIVLFHDRAHLDEFHWLRAENWRDVLSGSAKLSPEIQAHLDAENAYSADCLSGVEDLYSELLSELTARWVSSLDLTWSAHGAFEYGSQFRGTTPYPQLVRRKVAERETEVLVDLSDRAANKSYYRLGFWTHSSDHRYIAWAVDTQGSEAYTIRFFDSVDKADVTGEIVQAAPGGCFTADGRAYLYVGVDEAFRKRQLCLGRLENNKILDPIVLHSERDAGLSLHVQLSVTRRWIFVFVYGSEQTRIYVLPADDPDTACMREIVSDSSDTHWTVDEADGCFFGLTNVSGANDFKIVRWEPNDLDATVWTDVIPHRSGVVISDLRVFKTHIAWIEREGLAARVMTRRHSDGYIRTLKRARSADSMYLAASTDPDRSSVGVIHSALNEPVQRLEYDLDQKDSLSVRERGGPSWYDSNEFVSNYVMATSDDGALVPVSILHHRSTALDGTAPCLLFGYGAYGVRIPAGFEPTRLSLVERGFVYAIAHVRGGGEFGTGWHIAGRSSRKVAGVNDFLAAANTLASLGYCRRGRIVAHGISAGGVLVGAALNASPSTFCGVIAQAPFVDVLNTMLDDSLPLTLQERSEWGDPIAIAGDFDSIASWSPYENIKSADYPPVLAMTALNDMRVTYWEAAKWIARLRAKSTSAAPVMVRTEMQCGHQGVSGREGSIRNSAMIYSFVIAAANGKL